MTPEIEAIHLEFARMKEQIRELERKVRELIDKDLEKPEVIETEALFSHGYNPLFP